MFEKNKVRYGLKNVHYALITEAADGALTFGVPKRILGAVSIGMQRKGEKVNFPADDNSDYYARAVNDGYDGDLELALVPDEFLIDCLGERTDDNGVQVENRDGKAAPFALLFEFDGDETKTRRVLYYCRSERPDIKGETRGKNDTPQSEKLTLTARPRPDTGDVKAKCTQDKTQYGSWFEAVYSPVGATEPGDGED